MRLINLSSKDFTVRANATEKNRLFVFHISHSLFAHRQFIYHSYKTNFRSEKELTAAKSAMEERNLKIIRIVAATPVGALR
jgi:hypothetical protein